jgi:hypothetical protein
LWIRALSLRKWQRHRKGSTALKSRSLHCRCPFSGGGGPPPTPLFFLMVTREENIPQLQFTMTLQTPGPLGIATDAALIGVRVKFDSSGTAREEATYLTCARTACSGSCRRLLIVADYGQFGSNSWRPHFAITSGCRPGHCARAFIGSDLPAGRHSFQLPVI